MPPFHHHGRGQRDGIPPLFLPVGAVGSALAVLHVACCLAQESRRRRPEATRAHTAIPQAPSGPAALFWPHPQAPCAPPPRIVSTRGRPRQVDTSSHFCPQPPCA